VIAIPFVINQRPALSFFRIIIAIIYTIENRLACHMMLCAWSRATSIMKMS